MYRIKLDGTTKDVFDIGLLGISLDASAVVTPWTLTFPPSPGTSGYVLTTNGAGITSWSAVGAAVDFTVPFFISTGDTFRVNTNRQALYSVPIDIEGDLVVDGLLIQV